MTALGNVLSEGKVRTRDLGGTAGTTRVCRRDLPQLAAGPAEPVRPARSDERYPRNCCHLI